MVTNVSAVPVLFDTDAAAGTEVCGPTSVVFAVSESGVGPALACKFGKSFGESHSE